MTPTSAIAAPAHPRHFVARFSTSGKISVVQGWLAHHAKAGWNLQMDGISEDLLTKMYRIIFAQKNDYDGFRARFTRPDVR